MTSHQSLDVFLLGLVEFESCLWLQERLAEEISQRRDRHGVFLVCEHPPIVTMGREASHAHLACEPVELTVRNMEVRWLNRGGGAIVHAPGQLAAYPILPVDQLGFGLAELRARLELSLLDVCRELYVSAWREATEPGVWCRCGRLAALGVTVRSGVTHHGLFVNVSPSMDLQRMVTLPSGGRASSLAAQRLRPTSMHTVRESLIRNLSSRLGYENFHVYTGHPALRRTRQVVAIA